MGTKFRDVKGKVAIITGAARGIGQGCAEAMAAEGVHVIISDISPEIHATWEKIKSQNPENMGYSLQLDVTKESEVKIMFKDVIKKFGKIDILYNNAGINGGAKNITDVTENDMDKIFNVNVKGVVYGCKYASIQMKNQGFGTIVNCGSFYGKVGHAGSGIYGASKGAIHTLTQALALELAPYGVTVNAVCPALADTEMHWAFLRKDAAAMNITFEEIKNQSTATIPLKRLGTGADTAGAILWLASEAGSYVTGQLINVNGGLDFS
jgi:NAD(P)-dependent dehydrogenase (short-subunit alcohol dehydrogenase family)